MPGNEFGAVLALGALILLAAGLSKALSKVPLSVPVIFVALGWLASLTPFGLGRPFDQHRDLAQHLTATIMLMALMGAGLRIDRPFSLSGWSTPWRLLGLGMPLTIGLGAAAGMLAGLPMAVALLVSSILCPTDPVLAGDVGVGPPGSGDSSEVRFGLTAEAGLNDGLAYPFVILALSLAERHAFGVRETFDLFLWRPVLSAAVGAALGRLIGWLAFRAPFLRLSKRRGGAIALGVSLCAYASVELMGGIGFVAVFVSAAAFRSTERSNEFHKQVASFSEDLEYVLLLLALLAFGAELGSGLLTGLTWPDMMLALAFPLVIRPLAGWASFIGSGCPTGARAVMALFGVRGIGTLYYLLFVIGKGAPDQDRMSRVVSLVVLLSVVGHGIATTPVMAWVDERIRQRARKAGAR